MKNIMADSEIHLQDLKGSDEKLNVEIIPPSNPNDPDDPVKVILKYISEDTKDELFTVYIDYWEAKKSTSIRYVLHTDAVHDVDTMIMLLSLYRSFSNQKILVNGRKLFGDIIHGKLVKASTENVDVMINYWSRIQKLQTIIKKKFKLHMPVSETDIVKLDILSYSFIDKKPRRIGQLDNIVFEAADKDHLENLKGAAGDLAFVLNTPDEELCGVSLSAYYKAIFYGPIDITDYTILNESASGIKCNLKIVPHKDTVAAIMYFLDKKDADDFMSTHMEEFKQATSIGKNISTPE